MIIPVKVKKRILTCKKPLVSENVETYSVSISVDEEWEGFNTRVVFYNSSMEIGDNNPKNVVTQNIDEVTIPWEVLQESGYLYLTLIGTKDTEVIKTKEMDSPIIVNKAGMSEGGTPLEPTPDAIQILINTAQQAKDIAQSVRDDADAGKFNGPQGPKGDPGTTFDASNIGNGLKLENQELSVNTEGLDISKATVEDATQEMPATPLMSGLLFPLMEQISGYEDRFNNLKWKYNLEIIKENIEHYTIANAKDNQEIYIWLNNNEGINTGVQGVLTLDLFGNTITLGNLGTDITNVFLHIVRCNQQFAIIDFFDATSDTAYSLNINKSKGTFPVMIKDSASITLRTSAGNFTAGTYIYVFNKLWITNR